jgi:hypothetical protein
MYLATGDLPDTFGMLLDILLPPAPGVPCTDELCVVLEARRDSFAAVCVALDEFDHLCLFLVGTPGMESGEIGEDESISVISLAGAIGLFGDGC